MRAFEDILCLVDTGDICRHRIHQIWHTWGVMKTTKMNVVDNSALGRKAMAEGRPPKYVNRG